MSMLAGPRRKQKIINLRAKNSAWSNDTNKFGQRMLEKMGWSAGKGLGANENGIVEHIVARYKNDEKGLGYEDKNDQWTKHEDDFNSLLANLSNNSENNTENLHSGVSLEDKSKKSKARIHYHKFTRGKDLSRYSEKDLANIFGKKTFKQETVQEPVKDDNNKVEQKFTEKGNMDDYFKSKLALLNNKPKVISNDNVDREEIDYGFQGFSTETNGQSDECDTPKVGFEPFSFYGTLTNKDNKQDIADLSEGNEEVVKSKKKKKSKKKHANVDSENCSESQEVNGISEQNSEEQVLPVKKKKSKKDKTKEIDSECIESSKIKKKKRKNELECVNEDHQSDQKHTESLDNNVPKKKKKRKNKDE